MAPTITRIESCEFQYPLEDVGTDRNGFNLVYEPGETTRRKLFGIKIHTDARFTGEYVGGNSPGAAQINMFADYLVGENPLEREKHWSKINKIHGWGGSDASRNLDCEIASIETIDEQGRVEVPDGPGLGVDYDWEYIEEHRTGDLHVYE
nr:hypothetical protein [Haloterrigena salifodinae]